MIAFVVDRIGKPSETFIRRELIELAETGADFIVYALNRPRPGDVEVPEELDGLVFTAPGLLSLGMFFSKLRWLIFHPIRVLGCCDLAVRALLRPLSGLREIITANKAFRLASLVRRHRVDLIHAEFATTPATVAWVASRLTREPFSISVHAWDIFCYRTMLKAKLAAAELVAGEGGMGLRLSWEEGSALVAWRLGEAERVKVGDLETEAEVAVVQRNAEGEITSVYAYGAETVNMGGKAIQ